MKGRSRTLNLRGLACKERLVHLPKSVIQRPSWLTYSWKISNPLTKSDWACERKIENPKSGIDRAKAEHNSSSCAPISRMSYLQHLGVEGGHAGGQLTYHDRTSLRTIPLHIPYKYPLWVCDREMWVFVEFTKNSQQRHHNEREYVHVCHLSGLRQSRLLPPFSNIHPQVLGMQNEPCITILLLWQ